jgi:hypothetical protein
LRDGAQICGQKEYRKKAEISTYVKPILVKTFLIIKTDAGLKCQ